MFDFDCFVVFFENDFFVVGEGNGEFYGVVGESIGDEVFDFCFGVFRGEFFGCYCDWGEN